ncbi:hypothetical protein EYF80_050577 [Liparis tanakae]|uniref:Uncharacterized protein n=1 Tax=Liparis tanakae TaxID=230148 RepID=A0A4Z2FEP0_9TELE|nr:hypothetical protein EYF80_050577 [Liparis tanakae]
MTAALSVSVRGGRSSRLTLHGKAGLPAGRPEDRPPVQEVGRHQRRLAGRVRPDQHQDEALLQVRLQGAGHRLGAEPLVAEVQVERQRGAHLPRERLRLLEVLQEGLASEHLDVQLPPGPVHVGLRG